LAEIFLTQLAIKYVF